MHDLRESDFSYLLDEVLFDLHRRGIEDADAAEPTLDRTVLKVARQERLHPSPADVEAVAALAYEQLRGYQP